MALGIAIFAGYLAGFAHADLIVTWRQKRHVSVDGLFNLALSAICVISLLFIPTH